MPNDWLRSYQALPAAKRAEVDRLLAADKSATPWRPMVDEDDPSKPTPQRLAYGSPADELLYGGAAGGGKSDLLLGLALTQHRRSIIFRRLGTSLEPLIDRMSEILGGRGGLRTHPNVRWELPGRRLLEMGAAPNPGDEQKFQGRPHDLKAFDELTQFTAAQYRYLIGWNRTTDPQQRTRAVAATNPPTTAEGRWVIEYWAPWLDPSHPNPAKPGELRWFTTVDGEDLECDGPNPIWVGGQQVRPRSRTFIPSRIGDNPYLVGTGYESTLQAMPEPLRSQMLRGDFLAGVEDDPWQVIPTGWVDAAQARWTERPPAGAEMDALGVDPSRGGRDDTVLTPRYGLDYICQQIVVAGSASPDGPAVAAQVVAHARDGAVILIDVIGVGASVYDHLRGMSVQVVPIDSREASNASDRSGALVFANRRSELWWRMREALDPAYGSRLALPPCPKLRGDLCAPLWSHGVNGIQVEPKEMTIKRVGRSPDRGDSCIYSLEDVPKRGVRPGAYSAAALNAAAAQRSGAYHPHRWGRG